MSARVCTVVFSNYPWDVRVRREAEALIEAGMQVDLVCLQGPGERCLQKIRGVRVFRLPLQQKRGGPARYLWEYGLFTVCGFLLVSILYILRRYDVIHVHNMPDILVLTALLPRMLGARVILDLHDPMPEMYMTKFGLPASHPIIRLLRGCERACIQMADLVFTPNLAFQEKFAARGCPPSKIRLVMNTPQEEVFLSSDRKASTPTPEGSFVVMFHGLITERHGLDTALQAMARLRERIPGLIFRVYGKGDLFLNEFLATIQRLHLEDCVEYFGYVPVEEVAAAIPSIDVGIIPNKKTPFTNINLPTRIFEYLCLGKPVIVSRTKGVLDYFDEDSIYFFEPEQVDSLVEAVWRLWSNPQEREAILERGMGVYRKHRWQVQKQYFVQQVKSLFPNPEAGMQAIEEVPGGSR